MKQVFAVFKKFLRPPKFVIFSVSPIVFAALIFTFIFERKDSIAAYIIYSMSAYCLAVLIVPLPRLVQNIKAGILMQIKNTTLGGKYVNDLAFRTGINLCQGMIANFIYAIFRIVVSIRYASVWFISMAIYYLVLGIIRLSLILNYRNRKRINELHCYRRTAGLLILLNIPMGGMIALMVSSNFGYSYPGYVIYLSAMYTFYTMICSVINLVKFRKLGSPILSAAKVVNFIAALMSVLGLQTAMITRFSTDSIGSRQMMNAVTGSVVWVLVILIAVYMLYQSKKEVKAVEQIRK